MCEGDPVIVTPHGLTIYSFQIWKCLTRDYPWKIVRDRKLTYRVEIKPEFHESVSKEDIVAYEKHLIVKKKPKWIETPQFVHMSSATKGFNIIIDVAALRANTVHTTNVDLVEDGTSQRLVTIPITVVKEREHIFCSSFYENK